MIPSVGHFIWFGTDSCWLHTVAVRSAITAGRLDRIVVYHSDRLHTDSHWRELERCAGIELRRFDAEELLEEIPDMGPRLVDVHRTLERPAGRANLVRASLLYRHGGLYMDTDTITIGRLDDLLLESDLFCGSEHIAFPATVVQSRSPSRWSKAIALTTIREACRWKKRGWRWFNRIKPLFAPQVNNAVLGGAAGHPFFAELLERMIAMDDAKRSRRYALGTHLLQATARDWQSRGPRIYEPDVFYPLGPVLSRHLFRRGEAQYLPELVGSRTRVVHWYASVQKQSAVRRLTPDVVLANPDRRAICELAKRYAMPAAGDSAFMKAPTSVPGRVTGPMNPA